MYLIYFNLAFCLVNLLVFKLETVCPNVLKVCRSLFQMSEINGSAVESALCFWMVFSDANTNI